jgi:hypothetical protein
MAKMNLDKLQTEAQRLVLLLEDRHPGLMTWSDFFHETLDAIRYEIDGIESCVPAVREKAIAAGETGPLPLNQRMFDLVRYMRSELHTAGLITDDEYAELAQEHSAVKRLEDYDVAVARIVLTHEQKLNAAISAITSRFPKAPEEHI